MLFNKENTARIKCLVEEMNDSSYGYEDYIIDGQYRQVIRYLIFDENKMQVYETLKYDYKVIEEKNITKIFKALIEYLP